MSPVLACFKSHFNELLSPLTHITFPRTMICVSAIFRQADRRREPWPEGDARVMYAFKIPLCKISARQIYFFATKSSPSPPDSPSCIPNPFSPLHPLILIFCSVKRKIERQEDVTAVLQAKTKVVEFDLIYRVGVRAFFLLGRHATPRTSGVEIHTHHVSGLPHPRPLALFLPCESRDPPRAYSEGFEGMCNFS